MPIQNPNRAVAAARALALLFGLAAYPALGQSVTQARIDFGTLSVAIRDKASGKVVPAMICITSLADNTWVCRPTGSTRPVIIPTRRLFKAGCKESNI